MRGTDRVLLARRSSALDLGLPALPGRAVIGAQVDTEGAVASRSAGDSFPKRHRSGSQLVRTS